MSRAGSETLKSFVGLSLAVLLCGSASAQEQEERERFFTDSSTDRTPAITAFPNYPRVARRDRIEGDATVCFRIDLQGRIRSVRVKDYTHRIFRRPALRAIKDSSFEPLRSHERFTTARTCRTYRFRLEPLVVSSDGSQRRRSADTN